MMFYLSKVTLVFFLLFLVPSAYSQTAAQTNTQTDCKLSLGWEHWPPYQFKNDDQQITGLDIDLIRAISQEINCELTLIEMPWERLLRSNKLGNVKMTASTTKTAKREQSGYFSLPYRKEQMVLFTLRKNHFNILSIKRLTTEPFKLGLRKAVSFGEKFDRLLTDEQFKQNVQYVTSTKQNVKKLQRGRLDGFIDDFVSTTALIKQLGISDLIEVQPINIFSTNLHVMFSKRSVDRPLVDKFNRGIQALQDSGEYQKVMLKYLLNEE